MIHLKNNQKDYDHINRMGVAVIIRIYIIIIKKTGGNKNDKRLILIRFINDHNNDNDTKRIKKCFSL